MLPDWTDKQWSIAVMYACVFIVIICAVVTRRDKRYK